MQSCWYLFWFALPLLFWLPVHFSTGNDSLAIIIFGSLLPPTAAPHPSPTLSIPFSHTVQHWKPSTEWGLRSLLGGRGGRQSKTGRRTPEAEGSVCLTDVLPPKHRGKASGSDHWLSEKSDPRQGSRHRKGNARASVPDSLISFPSGLISWSKKNPSIPMS